MHGGGGSSSFVPSPADRAAARAVRLAHASAASPAAPVAAAPAPPPPAAADAEGYRVPPPEIAAFVERPESPSITCVRATLRKSAALL
jgi:hypothetical protein